MPDPDTAEVIKRGVNLMHVSVGRFRDVTLRHVCRLTSVVFADNRMRFLPHE
jgi:hypothetical protein